MKHPALTFARSHAMASGPTGSAPGVTIDHYAHTVMIRAHLFSETIVEGAALHLRAVGQPLIRPPRWSAHRWTEFLFTITELPK